MLRNKILLKLWKKNKMVREYNSQEELKQFQLEKGKTLINSDLINIDSIKEILEDNNIEYLFNITINNEIYDILHKKDYLRLISVYEKNNKENSIQDQLQLLFQEQTKQIEDNILSKITKIQDPIQNTKPIQEAPKNNDIYNNLDKYFSDFIEYKKSYKTSESSIKGYRASLRYLKYFTNEETDFSFRFFKDLQKNFHLIPKNFFKYEKYYKLLFKELLKIKDIEKYETLNNKTINNHFNTYFLLFEYLKYEEIIEDNPLTSIKQLLEEKETNKEEYTEKELKQIFNSNLDQDYKNMFKIALYTGLRIEEVLSIKKENIKDNIIYIDLKDTSSKKHQRLIPIHKNLITTIKQQIKDNKGEYLFFNGNTGNEVKNVGKRLNRRLKLIINIKEKTFHSFRKNFSQEIEMNTNSEESIKKYLMGHTNSKDVTHKIYNRGKINTNKLWECINQITFNF